MKRNLKNKSAETIEISDSDSDIDLNLDKKNVSKKSKAKEEIPKKERKTKVAKVKSETKENEETKKSKGRKRERDDTSDADKSTNKRKRTVKETIQSKNTDNTDHDPDSIKTKIETLCNNKSDKISGECSSVECTEWTDVEYICETNKVDKEIAKNITKLFNDENTIPFIARYRRYMTGGMEPDQLRSIKESYDQVKIIKQKASTIIKAVDKLGQWTPEIHSIIKSTKSLDDLEHIYSLFKPASKRSLAERAKEVGLGPISSAIMQGDKVPPLSSLVDIKKEGLKNVEEVKDGIKHILADIINRDKVIFDKTKILQENSFIEIQSTQSKSTESKKKDTDKGKTTKKIADDDKYKNYFNFKSDERNIKPHQILAINRGEAQKILTVKIIVPDTVEREFKRICLQRYRQVSAASKLHEQILNDSIDYAYKKFIKPLIVRRVRSEMKEKAETASIEVFVSNVKQLLLTPPIRGKIMLGVDPGFFHGCKLAVVSENGKVLDTAVIYPHNKTGTSQRESKKILIDLVKKYKVSVLALGNATACRETEMFVAKLIQEGAFAPQNISYTIVDESGASIYSCSTEAKSEFPDLDPNLISAVSIARRLQDPLAELVKVEPKHLGVGMYQHDLPEKQLMLSLNEVISEAVSFVGVDINTASHCLLRRVAGLNATKATNILEHKNKKGPFTNREQLLSVKGIGIKTYEQCAGFIRILPETALNSTQVKTSKNSKGMNFLDQTWIHPESYKIANDFLKYCKCNIENLGTASFIEKIQSYAKKGNEVLAKQFNTNETTMEIIIKGLTMKKDEDIRTKENLPIFRNALQSIDDLSVGTILSGVVRNVTHFGAFVDVGVGRNGLLHTRWMNHQTVNVGQRVEVEVNVIERENQRIGLKLIKIL